MKTHLEFNDGTKMPIVGFGSWQADKPETLELALDKALEVGYRHFDTAFSYGNEEVIGKVLNRWISAGKVKREELFIVTKLPIQGVHPDRAEFYVNLSLKRLQLDYIDLYLIHCPATVQATEDGLEPKYDSNGNAVLDTSGKIEDTWKVLEAQVKTGRLRSIGISNFSVPQIERILKIATVKPVNIQVELNVCYPKKQLREFCAKHGIIVCSFASLGSPGRKETYVNEKGSHLKVQVPELLTNPVVVEIAKKFNKTPAQILLKCLAQQGIAVIPKSVTLTRIAENINIFDFELDSESLKKLDGLDTGKVGSWSFDWQNYLPGLNKHPEFQLE